MSKLRLGLIGAGGMGTGLARTAKDRDDVQFVAVADPAAEALQKAVAELGGEAYASHKELLARDDIDAVLVATPNFAHCPVVLDAAAAGKHIFCEKPMALSVADCDAMIAAANRAGVKLMVGQVLRLVPRFAKVREIVSSGTLGKPLGVAIERCSLWGGRTWRSQLSLTGGILFEMNAHELDFMRSILGDAKTVYAAIPDVVSPGSDIPAINWVTVHFQRGGVGMLNSHVLATLGRFDASVLCERGMIRCDGGRVSFKARDGEEQVVPAEELAAMPGGVPVEIGSFVGWVLRDAPPVVTAQDGRAAVELAEAAKRSAALGQPVSLPLR
ncbi:MAG: Gfo/Idh/MocA family oxidoreductase [Armatimonadetes bacterium]|nr:Gfo/Idh/MocA family oxidoreductase [Armatimonadota bacterium]